MEMLNGIDKVMGCISKQSSPHASDDAFPVFVLFSKERPWDKTHHRRRPSSAWK
jgi:hypothetical protein